VRGLTAYRDGDIDSWVTNLSEAITHATVAAQRSEAERLARLTRRRERLAR
jgi:hypothetical protein